jgi:hypothetical protein
MTPHLESILDKRLSAGDAVAWGVWQGAGSIHVRSHADWFTEEQIQLAVHQLVVAANGLHQQRIQPVRLCWWFDRTRVFLAIRPDDVCLGIFVKNKISGDFVAVEETLEQFLALPEV